MKLKDLTSYLDSAVPLSLQEGYDNSGLQVGLPERNISSAIITLDVTEEVLNEAISNKCDVVISHHPLIFHPVKHLTCSSVTERILYEAVKNDVAVYFCSHQPRYIQQRSNQEDGRKNWFAKD